jgi:hypothetical protein
MDQGEYPRRGGRMTSPPPARASRSDPGGFQARADGQLVEVRSFDGALVGKVGPERAHALADAGIADRMPHSLRLHRGVRLSPARSDRLAGRPDLERMRQCDPGRYAALWQGSGSPHVGRGLWDGHEWTVRCSHTTASDKTIYR